MLSREAVFGNAEGPSHKKTVLYAAAALLAVGLVAAGVYFGFYNHKNTAKKTAGGPPASSVHLATSGEQAQRYSQQINQNLKSNDSQQYMLDQLEIAYGYLSDNDFDSAGKTLDDIKQKVPAADLNADYYNDRYQVDQHNGNTAAEKTDLNTLISLYKSQKNTQEADYFQKQLDAL